MQAADLRPLGLFDGLSDAQLGELVEAGTEVLVEPGVDLFHEGEHADCWWVLVDGVIELRRRAGREEMVVGRMDAPGRWAGGFRAWDENGVYLATGRGVSPGRVLRVPAEVLRERSDAWFPFGGHLIEGLFRTARTIESNARQRDALVTLGTLSAGLAHEINNPTAAAARSVDALEETCTTLLSSLRQLAEGEISAAEFTALDALRLEIEPRRSGSVDPLAVADLEDALSTWLADNGVERDWVIAPALAAAGVDVEWCERASTILGPTALEAGLEWVASTFATSTLLGELKESTRRVSELVGAVRSYSQMDRGSVQRIDLTEGLESTLVMLGHKLRGGVTVVREYGSDVPQIEAYAGELNQVWTNLIDNAVDAMEGVGTLTIATRKDGDFVVVEVRDTGPGMPPQVVARAFEAFFTTKDVGKGSGLGLDIARRIVVDRHGGDIEIDSRPGSTILRVRLPGRPPG
jgi:signal transduction histidine kinase